MLDVLIINTGNNRQANNCRTTSGYESIDIPSMKMDNLTYAPIDTMKPSAMHTFEETSQYGCSSLGERPIVQELQLFASVDQNITEGESDQDSH